MFENHEIKHYGLGVLQGTMFKMIESTGLKDEKGKEIYDGDIVHWKIFDSGWNGNEFFLNRSKIIKQGIGQVYWCSDHYKIKGCKKTISSLVYSSSKEVVGNIYQNSELLK